MWTDTHAHIDKLKPSPEEILKQAQQESVKRIITIGTEISDWPEVIKLCEEHKPMVYGTLGMHPHTSNDFDDRCEKFLRDNLNHERIVAVGEIGLDYYYENSEIKKQKEIFEKQLQIAHEFNLPVEIHTRDAEEDTQFFLNQFKGKVRGLLHCFTSSYELARAALDCGFNISFSGIITFKNAENLRETCKKLPLSRIHIETDSPYLAPVPFRGKENQPAYVGQVAETVAFLHNVDLQTLSEQLEKNTLDLFTKIKKES